MGIMHANFQVTSFTGVGGERGARQIQMQKNTHGSQAFLNRSLYEILKLLL